MIDPDDPGFAEPGDMPRRLRDYQNVIYKACVKAKIPAWGPNPGQSHLNFPGEQFEHVFLFQAGFEAFGLDAEFTGFFLTQEV